MKVVQLYVFYIDLYDTYRCKNALRTLLCMFTNYSYDFLLANCLNIFVKGTASFLERNKITSTGLLWPKLFTQTSF